MRVLPVVLALALAVPGCITFYGPSGVEVQVLVTEDVGTEVRKRANVTVQANATVMDALREIATIETRYGGGFVQAIDGLESRYPDEKVDWFYHVNTEIADVGAASNTVEDGDLVVWDYRPWNRTMTLPHVLTGLDRWPANVTDDPQPTPDAWDNHASDPQFADRLFARVDGTNLTLLDEWGRPARMVEAPWLLVHAVDGPTSKPDFLVRTSGPDGLVLADRIPDTTPVGIGVALTPNETLEVPR